MRAESEDDEISTKGKKPAVKHNVVKVSEIENVIIEIINENNNKGRRTGLGEIGSRIQKKYNDFDVRQYGYSSLSTFIDEIDSFVLIKENNTVHVALKEDNDVKEKVVQFAKEYVKKAGKNGIDLVLSDRKYMENILTLRLKNTVILHFRSSFQE